MKNTPTASENANLICRSVNAHERLIAACADAALMLESPKFQAWLAKFRTDDEFFAMASAMSTIVDTLNAALASAAAEDYQFSRDNYFGHPNS